MFQLQLIITFFFLLQSSTYLAIPCEDHHECIPSISNSIAGNHKSEQVASAVVMHDMYSRKVEAGRSVLTDFSTTNGRVQIHVDTVTLAQLTSGKERIAPRGLIQGFDEPITDLFSLAKSSLNDLLSDFQTAVRVEKQRLLEDSSGVSSPLPATSSLGEPAISGRPIAVSTIPLGHNGSKPSFRLIKRDVLNKAKDSTSHLIAVSTLPLRTFKGFKPTYRSRRKILSFPTENSFHTLLSRAGIPLSISTIPVSKEEEEAEQVLKEVVSPDSAKPSLPESFIPAARQPKHASVIALREESKNQWRRSDYAAFVEGILKTLSPSK